VTVGLLGGAFDPPHVGHVALAEAAIRRFGLELLLVVVTGDPPHKDVEADAETRWLLARAAFAGRERIEVSRLEIDRDRPSYTVDTARWAEKEFGDTIFLVGADEFAGFLTWRQPDTVLDHVRLGVATRPGYDREVLDHVLAKLRRPERVELFEIPELSVSSTGIRARVARGEQIDGLVPPAVEDLIRSRGLYAGPVAPD
jgi:nicotinate-nucleotide adenylyltransferase